MSKYYSSIRRPPTKPRPWNVHPIWRGIGCFLAVLIPVMSYAGAVLLVQENVKKGWFPIPWELAKTVTIQGLGRLPYFYATLITTVLLIFIGFGVLVTIYALVYSIIGPPRLTPIDSEPIRGKVRRSR